MREEIAKFKILIEDQINEFIKTPLQNIQTLETKTENIKKKASVISTSRGYRRNIQDIETQEMKISKSKTHYFGFGDFQMPNILRKREKNIG